MVFLCCCFFISCDRYVVQNVFDVISRVIDVGTMSFQRVISPVILPTPQGCYNVGLLHLAAVRVCVAAVAVGG